MAFVSSRTTIELLDPIDGSTLVNITTKGRSASVSRRPSYGSRGYHRNAAVTAARLRNHGSISLQLTADDLSLLQELERRQRGVVWYPMAADLKGKRYRQPNIRITFTDAAGAAEEVVTAYGVKLSDESLDLPLGPAKESITLDVMGGFSPVDTYEPVRALDFHRTGSATYLSTAGTLTTATDSQARIGLPWVVRRNLLLNSEDFSASYWTKNNATVLANQAEAPDGSFTADLFYPTTTGTARGVQKYTGTGVVATATAHTATIYVKSAGFRWCRLIDVTGAFYSYFDLTNGVVGSAGTGMTTSIESVGSGWYRIRATSTTSVTSAYFIVETCDANGSATSTASGTNGLYIWGAQFEQASTATVYQPTNATGVDLMHPLNGAGLVLEGVGSNLLTANQSSVETDTTGFAGSGTYVSNTSTLARSSTQKFAGDYSLSVITPGTSASEGVILSAVVGNTANTAHTFSGRIYASAGQQYQIYLIDSTNGITGTPAVVTGMGGWQYFYVTNTTGASTANLWPVVRTLSQVATTFYLDVMQVERSPFPTSWMLGGTSRLADLVGIVPPHNEIKHSHDLTQAAAWTVSGMGQPAKAGADNTVTFGSTAHYIYQAVTPSGVASTTCTGICRLKAGTLSGSVLLRLLDQSGNVIASTTISTSSLSASDSRTFAVTGTAASDDTGLRLQLIGSSGTGTVIVQSLGLVKGSHPGPEVRTTDTPIPAPVSPALDPAWQQNGRVSFTILPPPPVSGKHYNLLGYYETIYTFGLWRSSGLTGSQIVFDRKHNGTTGTGGTATRAYIAPSSTALYDGAPHVVTLEWANYIVNGVRAMPLRMYIDGTLIGSVDAATYGATAWAAIDPSRLVSDNLVFAVLSGLSLSYPTLPAGAIPAT